MDLCKITEPKVINTALLEKCILESLPKGEPRRLVELEGINLEIVTQIRLEFLNILRIDHLWVLTSLTRLSLNNNLIEKIENLGTLIHLKELDLSFNKIKKIENLETLKEIEKLSFFSNCIERIENMDTLKKLNIFSIGRNQIDDIDNVLYLRGFPALRCLNMAKNPCAEDPDFRLFIAAFLSQLVYYEYRLIKDLEIELGKELYSVKLAEIEMAEAEILAVKEKEENELADAELHSRSFVEFLNTTRLFDSLWIDDEEGRAFLKLGDEVMELYKEYEEQFNTACRQIFDVGQREYLIRQEELDQFLKCVNDAKNANQQLNIKIMEEFLEQKAEDFYRIKKLLDLLEEKVDVQVVFDEIEQIGNNFEKRIHEIWKNLMKLELELHQQVEEVNTNFEHTMAEMVNLFIEAAQGTMSGIRALEVTYSENVAQISETFYTNLNVEHSIEVPEALKQIMSDKDSLINAIAASHDAHLQIIENREDTLVSRARGWLDDLVNGLEKDEIKRNRMKVLEINHFLDMQTEEFNELTQNTLYNKDEDINLDQKEEQDIVNEEDAII